MSALTLQDSINACKDGWKFSKQETAAYINMMHSDLPMQSRSAAIEAAYPDAVEPGTAASAEPAPSVPVEPAVQAAPISGLKACAQQALDRGFYIFLLQPKSKKPFPSSHGFKDASNSPSMLANWDVQPDANIGIACGESNLCVLDFDKGWMPEWLQNIRTFKVKTVKGWHVYFRGCRKTAKMYVGGECIGDIKSIGGYVLFSGSVHPDGPVYTTVDDSAVADAPTEIATLLQPDEQKAPPTVAGDRIPRGQHDIELHRIAGSLRRIGLEEEAIYGALIEVCEKRCDDLGDDYEKMSRKHAHEICKKPAGPPVVLVNGRPAGSAQPAALPVTVPAAAAVPVVEAGSLQDKINKLTSEGKSTAEIVEQLGLDECPADCAADYRIVGAEAEPTSDVLLAFPSQVDADIAADLGFDSVAVLPGNKQGDTPFRTSIAMLKMKWKHCAVFGSSQAAQFLQENIQPGSIEVSYPEDLQQPKGSRRKFPRFTTLSDAVQSSEYGEFGLQMYLHGVCEMQAVRQATILRTTNEANMRLNAALDKAKSRVGNEKPGAIVTATLQDLRKLEAYDDTYPSPLSKTSLHGLLGEFVEIAYPTTIACRELILYQLLPIIGCMMGSAYYVGHGSTKHYPSLFCLNIARTAEGKGQAQAHVESAAELIDPAWYRHDVHSNPASGEGLIRMLGFAGVATAEKQYRKTRVAIFNSEMASCFKAQGRDGSTLGETLRKAYDGVRLENFRSSGKQSAIAEDYLLGFCGSITPSELEATMPKVDWKNGSANRFLWSVTQRETGRKRGQGTPDFKQWAGRVGKLIELNMRISDQGKQVQILYSPEAQSIREDWEDSLPESNDDALSESQTRAPANCARLANLYAQLDERRLTGWQPCIEAKHVQAAIELIRRSRESVEYYLSKQQAGQRAATTQGADYSTVQKLKQLMLKKIRETGEAELTSRELYNCTRGLTPEERDASCIQAGFRPVTRTPTTGGPKATVWLSE